MIFNVSEFLNCIAYVTTSMFLFEKTQGILLDLDTPP